MPVVNEAVPASDPAAPQRADPELASDRGVNVLLVDDQPANLIALRAILTGQAAHLVTACSGEEALRWLTHHDAAAILLDVAMPTLDGFETAKLIRLRPRSHDVPILFVTAFAGDDIQRSDDYRLFAVDYLVKPLNADVVRAKVAVFIKLETQRRELEAGHEKLRIVAEELRRSNRELATFASIASHDLQQPLRKIRAFGDSLLHKHREALPPDARHSLDRMVNAAEQMQNLVESLLTYSRITTKAAATLVSVDMATIAREVIVDLERQLAETKGSVEIGELPMVLADPTQMRQLLQNLVANALKFHRRNVAPVIKLGGRDVENPATGEVEHEIRIEDNGIGFEQEHAEKIFGIFHRLHGRSEYDGTGIGLAICRRVVERHHGTIVAEGAPDMGATFIVRMPAAPQDWSASWRKASPREDERQGK